MKFNSELCDAAIKKYQNPPPISIMNEQIPLKKET